MNTFWQIVLLGEHTYIGSPFPPHANLQVTKEHFGRWLELFFNTINKKSASTAAEAKWRASKMAEIFQFKIGKFQELA